MGKMRYIAACMAVALALGTLGAGAEDDEKAYKLFKQGVDLAKEGKYEEALKFFEEARMRGAPDETLFNMGKCYEGLGLFHVAADYYEQYIDSPDAKHVDKVKEVIEELEIKPSPLNFTSDPPGAEVRRVLADGTDTKLGVTPFEYTAEAGEFTFVVVKKGFEPKEVTITTGFGRPFDLEIDLTTDVVEVEVIDRSKKLSDLGEEGETGEEEEPGKPEKPRKPPPEFPRLGLAMEMGSGVALYPYKGADFKAGGIISFRIGYRFSKGPESGLSVGLHLDARSYRLDEDPDYGGRSWQGWLVHVLAVPAYQFKVHPRLAVEASLPLGFAVLTSGAPGSAHVDLVDGRITGSLALFDLGVGAALRIMIVSGLYATVEPVRLHLLFPLKKWGPDAPKALADLDIAARIGFQF
jgi:hypothetical protein